MSDALSAVLPDETRLVAEINRLKAEFPKTREPYREVCALLFFRFGQTPTANRLYQLVRRGSMGTPAAVLGEFWTELREKSRVRIDHPDLPADLGVAAGELVATLWTRATASATTALDALRDEVETARADAQRSVAAAREELGRIETALEQRTAALLAAQVEVRELDRAQAEGHAQRQALEAELGRIRAALAVRDRELVEVREGFSRDLEKQREAAEHAEDRLRASEKRALLEIDRERSTAAKLQKELDETTRRADRREADHRRAVEALQAQLGDARHQAGVLQGRLDSVQATNATLQEQLAARHAADVREMRPVRPKATTRSTAARPARTPGPPRKAPAASMPSGKTAARPQAGVVSMAGSSRPRTEGEGRTGATRRKAPACPPIGALTRYGERTVRVIAEASGQRVIIESVGEDGRTFRSTVKWANLARPERQLF